MAQRIHLKSPEGKTVSTSGRKLADDLKARGWSETEAPEKKPRKGKGKNNDLYWSDSAFRGY